jgi:hypothetical protein
LSVKNKNTDLKDTPHADVRSRVKLVGRSIKRQKTKTNIEKQDQETKPTSRRILREKAAVILQAVI